MKNKEVDKQAEQFEIQKKASKETIEKIQSEIIDIIEEEEEGVLKSQQERLQRFQEILNRSPRKELQVKHHYLENVVYLPIAHIEALLDVLFFGQWGTSSFQYKIIENELTASIELKYIDPITAKERIRTGVASEQIGVLMIEEEERNKMKKADINIHALDMANKKPNALSGLMGTLKSACVKNAAKEIGNIFGRSLNRYKVDLPFQEKGTDYDHFDELIK